MANGPVILDLPSLPTETELSRPVAEALALAASVALDRISPSRERDPALIAGGDVKLPAELRRVTVDEGARRTYADHQEATEEGAEAVAILVARRVLTRIVFQRLPKMTGADYLMRDPEATDGDAYERLECSGIAEGQESMSVRLRAKLQQLARFPSQRSGVAIVRNFRMDPVDIRNGGWPT